MTFLALLSSSSLMVRTTKAFTRIPTVPRTATAVHGPLVRGYHSSPTLLRGSGRPKYSGQGNRPSRKKLKQIKKEKPPNQHMPREFKINQQVNGTAAAEKLAAAFDELARQDGFDGSLSFHAPERRFEEETTEQEDFQFYLQQNAGKIALDADDLMDEDFEDGDGADDDMDVNLDPDDDDEEEEEIDFGANLSDAAWFNEKQEDKEVQKQEVQQDDGDTFLSMEERIRAAKRDMDMGRVTVPDQLEEFAEEATTERLRALGYKPEKDPFGDDETPLRRKIHVVTSAMVCTACGSDFQSYNEQKPGYLPPEKFETQVKLSKIEEMQKLVEKREGKQWSPEDEVEWLIQTGGTQQDNEDLTAVDIQDMAEEMGLDLEKLTKKPAICKRCHGLQNFGKVDVALRPGWTEEPMLAQKQFRELLTPLKDKPAVIIALVDIFDFTGSVLPELDNIVGDNPVFLAANKADLLPPKMGRTRVENWVRRELEYLGVKSIGSFRGAVRLVSCKTGVGIPELLEKARLLAEEMQCDIYVVGAANAGKSTLLNQILSRSRRSKFFTKRRPGNRNAAKGLITTSPLPGTTLKFIKVQIDDNIDLYDTPGLLIPGTITQLLTPEELKIVVPAKRVEPITFRLEAGKCVMVGGLARVELVGDCKPFMFTFYVANTIKLHVTKSEKADDLLLTHAGTFLTPPLPPGPERMKEIGEFEDHVVDIEGRGWKEAGADISLTGLGWVAVTGAGSAKVKISVPQGIGVLVRPPLMPFDIWEVASRYTGARSVRKSSRSKSGKRRKGVGRM